MINGELVMYYYKSLSASTQGYHRLVTGQIRSGHGLFQLNQKTIRWRLALPSNPR